MRDKGSGDKFKLKKSETRRKLFDQDLMDETERMSKAGMLEYKKQPAHLQSMRSKSKKVSMLSTVHHASAAMHARKVFDNHSETHKTKLARHAKHGKAATNRLTKRLSKRSIKAAMQFTARKKSAETKVDEIQLDQSRGGEEKDVERFPQPAAPLTDTVTGRTSVAEKVPDDIEPMSSEETPLLFSSNETEDATEETTPLLISSEETFEL